MSTLKKISKGDPILAEQWNQIVDICNIVENIRGDGRTTSVSRLGTGGLTIKALSQGGCAAQNAWYDLYVFGFPTSGSCEIVSWIIDGQDIGGPPIEFDWDASATDVHDAMQMHQSVGDNLDDDGNEAILVTGGPFPYNNIRIQFQHNLGNLYIPAPLVSYENLEADPSVGMCFLTICSQLGNSGD